MATHTVNLADHPTAAAPLAALFVASQRQPAEGDAGKDDRAKLARIVSKADPVLAKLLRAGGPIEVRPRAGLIWEVIPRAAEEDRKDEENDAALMAVVRVEMERQGLTATEVAAKAGITQAAMSRLLSGDRGARWSTAVRLIEDGLGKSMAWFGSHWRKGDER